MDDGKRFVFPMSKEEFANPLNRGKSYVYGNKDKWVDCSDRRALITYLTVGQDPGRDIFVLNDVAYHAYKAFLDMDEDAIIFLVYEAEEGCNID